MDRRQLIGALAAVVAMVAVLNALLVVLALAGLPVLALGLLLVELGLAVALLHDARQGAPRARRVWRRSRPALLRLRSAARGWQARRIGDRVGERVGERPVRRGAAARLRASGLFDEEWYRQQLGPRSVEVADAVDHYVATGWREGLSANAAFDDAFYLAQLDGQVRHGPPVVHYAAARRRAQPHPAFDQPAYLARHPDSTRHPGGPLGHFLGNTGEEGRPGAAASDPRRFVEVARSAWLLLEGTRGTSHLPRTSPTHDEAAEGRFKADLRRRWSPSDEAPLVSVVVPTLDRAGSLPATLDSVLAQTYPHWELLVVDDGSSDQTPALLARYATADPRVRVLRHDRPQGVSRARNHGLAEARGHYVAYLDSDNTWVPDFLELMVAFLEVEGHRAAYAMSALEEEGGKLRRLFRGMPFDRAALEEQNYIDCICLVHERSLLDEVGGFDESLRRNVDWDLLIRMAARTDFGFAPFVASRYDVWEGRTGRITSDVPRGYRFRVRQRTLLSWPDADHLAEPTHDVSVVTVVPPQGGTVAAVQALADELDPDCELVVVDRHADRELSTRLHFLAASRPHTRHVRLPQPLTDELARNVGALAAGGRHLVFVPLDGWRQPGWLEPLVTALAEHAVAMPLHLDQHGSVLCAGLEPPIRPYDAPAPRYAGLSGTAPEVRGVRPVWGAPAFLLAARRDDVVAVGGFDPLTIDDPTSEDLSRRLVAATGLPAACVGASVVVPPAGPAPSTARRAASKAAREEATAVAALQRRERGEAAGVRRRAGAEAASEAHGYTDDGFRQVGTARSPRFNAANAVASPAYGGAPVRRQHPGPTATPTTASARSGRRGRRAAPACPSWSTTGPSAPCAGR